MNMTSSGTFAKRYYAEVLSNPTATTEAKERAAQRLLVLEKIRSSARRDARLKKLLQAQLATVMARNKELEALSVSVPVQPVFRTLREMAGLPPAG
jgi:hypothetical protein